MAILVPMVGVDIVVDLALEAGEKYSSKIRCRPIASTNHESGTGLDVEAAVMVQRRLNGSVEEEEEQSGSSGDDFWYSIFV